MNAKIQKMSFSIGRNIGSRFCLTRLMLVFIAFTLLLQPQKQTVAQEQNEIAERDSWNPEQLLQLGYQAYHKSNWLDAVKYLSEAALSFPDNDLLYIYLGTAHQILGQNSLAEQTLITGVNLQGENMQKIAFVLGNYYYSLGRYDKALDAYNLATWGQKQLVQAFLNRANLYLSHGFYSNALNDYTYFLFRKPFDAQREKIEKVIDKLMKLGAQGRIQKDGGRITGNGQYPENGKIFPQSNDPIRNGLAESQGNNGNSFGGDNNQGKNATNLLNENDLEGGNNASNNQGNNPANNATNLLNGNALAGSQGNNGNSFGGDNNQGKNATNLLNENDLEGGNNASNNQGNNPANNATNLLNGNALAGSQGNNGNSFGGDNNQGKNATNLLNENDLEGGNNASNNQGNNPANNATNLLNGNALAGSQGNNGNSFGGDNNQGKNATNLLNENDLEGGNNASNNQGNNPANNATNLLNGNALAGSQGNNGNSFGGDNNQGKNATNLLNENDLEGGNNASNNQGNNPANNGLASSQTQVRPNSSPTSGNEGAYQEQNDGYSNAPDSLKNGLNNSLSGGYNRPADDSGNTVGTGGNSEAQMQQLNRVRKSLQQLNQSAVILSRDRPEIIEQVEEFSSIDE